MEKVKRRSWTFRTNKAFWARKGLSLEAKGIACVLLCFADEDGRAWPTTPQIATMSGKAEATVDRYLNELRKFGAISWTVWADELGRRRRKFDLSPIYIAPWDGLGGKKYDGRRTVIPVTE